MTAVSPESVAGPSYDAYLDTVEGEINFFRSLMRTRPVGINCHFHVMAMRFSIHQDSGQWVSIDGIWTKLRSLYDIDTLNTIDIEIDGYQSPKSNSSTPIPIPSPKPGDDFTNHPFFKEEYSLPYDEYIDNLISTRRMRATPSVASPTPSPSAQKKAKGRRKGKTTKSQANYAGLVGGDSDSSALTQESGDEGAPTPRESVVTGTDGGTEDAEDEDVEMHEPSPAPSATTKGTKQKAKSATAAAKRAASAARARAAQAAQRANKAKKKK
ncbi:hypothetical protein EDD18DRAFT_1345013 [Armillaria luteobubalina]|uniref:Chromatin modification-related protein EAF7 n=1 Tax=Armillaria luteobubalina TaxID=153913 RepID=A0AA39QKS8_9AGAR|nr:hypothetical protein EDD18DRAFT_1345013 [Armillaria luteobubalina]